MEARLLHASREPNEPSRARLIGETRNYARGPIAEHGSVRLARKYYFPYQSPAAVIDGRSPRYRDVIQEVASAATRHTFSSRNSAVGRDQE
jgi:hypothetical protein